MRLRPGSLTPITMGLICLILSAFSTYASDNKKLTVRGSDNYPPFEFINKNGEPDGFNVAIFKALMEELGYKYEIKLDNWVKVIDELKNKQIDAVIGMIYSPERASEMRFSLPICIINRNYITRNKDEYTSFSQLKDKELIVEDGGWFHRYVEENEITKNIIKSDDIFQSLNLLKSGKHDAVLASELVAHYAIKELGIKDLKIGSIEGIKPQNYSIVVNQDNDELLYNINIGLQRIKISGKYDKIYNEWFGIYEANKSKKVIYISLAVFLVVASILALFVLILKKQIARATRMLSYAKQEIGIAIDAGKISAWTYIIKDFTIKSLHGNSLGGNGSSIEEVYQKIHPDDLNRVKEEFRALSLGTKNSSAVSFRISNDGSESYSYVETKMLRVEANKDLPCRIVGTLKDITKDVMMHQQLEDYRLKTGFIVTTNDIVLTQYDIESQSFIRINDYDKTINRKYSLDEYFNMIHPEDVPTAKSFIAKLNKAKDLKVETELRICSSPNNSYNWYSVTAVAYKYDKQGNIVSYIGLRHNNTKWKEINNDLIELREKAEASNKLKSAFLANMSHEIRTPLNAIVGFSELITETDNQGEKETYIELVRHNNELLLQLISDVLDLARIESGYIGFTFSTFNFAAYFNELYKSLNIKSTDNVKLVCINNYEELTICSDEKRITQVITNFVTNAFKFTSKGIVSMEYTKENNGIRISVTDTGIGISPENLTRIFDRFEKLNEFMQGTGLGLSICKEIAEALHGKIGVESQTGKGSTFWLWIPVSPNNKCQ